MKSKESEDSLGAMERFEPRRIVSEQTQHEAMILDEQLMQSLADKPQAEVNTSQELST